MLCALLSCGYAASAQADEALDKVKADVGQQLFFDSSSTSFTRDLTHQVFEGNVVAIGAGTLIGADLINLDRATNVMDAKGKVVVMSRNQLFLGDEVHYNLTTTDFEITNAVMLSNDPKEIERQQHKVFSFSPQELEFEEKRRQELAAVEEERLALRQLAITRGKIDDEMVSRYAVLLEKAALIASQESPVLAKMPKDQRERLKRRRDFWEASKKSALAAPASPILSAYLHLEGDTLTRLNGNDYSARNALFTPCRCEQDESPAWAFRSDRLDAQIGGYADLTDAVLEIKGVPVLYLPHIKLPLKEKRQSGFLMPTAGYDSVSGNTYTQPLFFDLGPSSDATATTDIYENRGTRLGLEYRVQQRELSGWDLHIEGIRDSLWMQQIGNRQALADMYRSGLAASQLPGAGPPKLTPDLTAREFTRRSLEDPAFWAQPSITSKPLGLTPEQQIDTYMSVPRNTWRGAYNWRGVSFLAPRLSLASSGEVTSDHRYTEELYLPDNFNEAFYGGRIAKAFSTANVQAHLDGKEFYAGLGTRYGDNYLTNQRFEGQQLPAHLKLQSRLVELTPEHFAIPVYGELIGENIQISQATAGDTIAPPADNLGGGTWRRLAAKTTAPLLTDSIIQVSQFTSAESRFITHSGLETKDSHISSWVAGFEFRLPIDGKSEAPAWLRSTACEDARANKKPRPVECPLLGDAQVQQFIHHVMDWRLRLSARPVVVKRGPYTEVAGKNLAYFASDIAPPLGSLADQDRDVSDEDRMNQTQRVTLITDHSWSVLGKGWQRLLGALPDTTIDPGEKSIVRARRELVAGLEQTVNGASSMYDESTQRWLIDRFQLKDTDYGTPLTFHADIAYDFLDAKARKKVEAENAGLPLASQALLPEAWKPLNTNMNVAYASWNLRLASTYNIYRHAPTTESILLVFPTYLKSTLALGYELGKTFQSNDRNFQQTIVRSLSLDTGLIPSVTSFIRLSRQVINGQPTDYTTTFKTAYGLRYLSSSDCWGLQFAREKDYSTPEANASYVLRLSMVFMGQERPLPDMSGGVVHQSGSQRTL